MLATKPWAAPPPAEARERAREILSRSEFQPPPRSLYERVLDAIGEWIGNLFNALVGGGAGSFVAWVIVLAAVAFIAYLVVRGVQSGRPRRAEEPAFVVDVEARRPADAWEAEAAAQEAAGNWREGLRCRYRALIARLARRGVVEEIPGRTAGEYRRTVAKTLPAGAPAFGQATDLFEGVWYGGRATGPAEADAFRGLADQVVER